MRAWRSIASARSSLVRAVAVAAVVLGFFGAGRAEAQQLRVAVLPVEGPQGDKATREILKAVKKNAELVPDADWAASAKKLFATSRSASDLSAVAGDLGVQVVITGKVKKTDEGWELSVGVRHGPTGKAAVKLKYPLKGPRVDAVTLRRLAEEVVPALDTAASGPPGTEAPESPEKPLEASDTTDQPTEPVEESPLEGTGPPKAQSTERPPWAPFIEGSASFVFGGRNFGFDEANSPSFRATVAPGLFIDATVYPFAFMASKTDGGKNALSGLGIGGDYGQAFWADSVPCYPTSMGTCAPTTDRFTTGEYRYEVGLRWKWNIARKAEGVPELLAQLQYGNHTFFIQKRAYLMDFPFGATGMDKKPAPRDIGPPDVSYSYMSVGLGARLPFAKRFAAQLNFNWHIMLGTGDIQQPSEWGPGGAFGFRLSGHFDIMIVKGAFARITGYAEYYGLSFNQPPGQHNLMPPCPCGTTGSASDVYYGGMFGVGYRY